MIHICVFIWGILLKVKKKIALSSGKKNYKILVINLYSVFNYSFSLDMCGPIVGILTLLYIIFFLTLYIYK